MSRGEANAKHAANAACVSWSRGDTSLQSRSKVLLAVCYPLLFHLFMLYWHPNASSLSLKLKAQLASLGFPGGPHSCTCLAQVVVLNDKPRAMQKICGNANSSTPWCLVLWSNHWMFPPSGRHKGPEG